MSLSDQQTKTILFKRLAEQADLREPAYPGDAGLDVVCVQDAVLEPGRVGKVELGLSVAVPSPHAFTFLTRSGAVTRGLFVLPTLIDSGYRGPLFLFVLNTTQEPAKVEAGSRIAQLLLLPNLHAEEGLFAMAVDELPESVRGANGFHSTGS